MNVRWLAATALLVASPALAQEKKPLRWGTDPTGGAPFIYKNNKDEYVGFEVEVAAYLAAKMNRDSVMVDGDWANLPEQLKKPADIEKGVDVILNGYELRKDFADTFGTSRAYYVYRLSLFTKKDHPDLVSWADLARKTDKKLKIAVLGGSASHKYVMEKYGDTVELLTNADVANVFKLVAEGRLDGTVQDSPTSAHFLKEYPTLKVAGEPVQPGKMPGYYVIYYRKGDAELGKELDAAIAEGIKDGTFKRIYEKYDVWTEDQEQLKTLLDQPWPPAFDASEGNNWPRLVRQLVRAAGMTLFLAVVSFPLAMVLGLLIAIGRVYGPWLLRFPLGVYVEVIRGTPLLLQLFFIYYVVPDLLTQAGLGWLAAQITPLRAGILGLAINYSASEAENYRAGLQAVPKGQMEAALALGMSPLTAIRRVVVPQAVRVVIPPVTNDFIALFKDTSACSILFVTELTRRYNELFNFNRGIVVELALITAGLYLIMSYPLAVLARRLEKKLGSHGGGTHR